MHRLRSAFLVVLLFVPVAFAAGAGDAPDAREDATVTPWVDADTRYPYFEGGESLGPGDVADWYAFETVAGDVFGYSVVWNAAPLRYTVLVADADGDVVAAHPVDRVFQPRNFPHVVHGAVLADGGLLYLGIRLDEDLAEAREYDLYAGQWPHLDFAVADVRVGSTVDAATGTRTVEVDVLAPPGSAETPRWLELATDVFVGEKQPFVGSAAGGIVTLTFDVPLGGAEVRVEAILDASYSDLARDNDRMASLGPRL